MGGNSARKAPRGEGYTKAGIKFQTVCSGCVTKRATPAPKGEGYIKGNDYIKIARIYKFTAIFLLKCGEVTVIIIICGAD